MSSPPAAQPASNDGPCMVCCSTRASSVGMITGGLLGLVIGGVVDLIQHSRRAVVLKYRSYPNAERLSATLLIASSLSLGTFSYFSAAYPASNKGYDVDLPSWSWNGASAGLVAAPFAASSFYWSSRDIIRNRTFSYFSKCLIGALVPSFFFGGLLLQDYWRLIVLDTPWGGKCLPPRTPRKFKPVDSYK